MSDIIFRDELPLADITDDVIGEEMIEYYREHEEELPLKARKAIAARTLLRDHENRLLEKVDAKERSRKFGQWVDLFLNSRKSAETRKNYQHAIDRLFAFCSAEGIDAASLTYEQARRFTTSAELANNNKKGGRRHEQSIRTDIAAISSLYSELDRLSGGKIRNPFLRIDTKPGKDRSGDKNVPTAEELEEILARTSGQVRAAIAVMSFRGLRIGALPGLTLATRDGKTTFRTFTKGKEQAGVLPQQAMDAIEEAGLSRKAPFGGVDVKALTKRVEAALNRIAADGKIAGHPVTRKIHGKDKDMIVADYSCHSFRHFYAVTEYGKDHDIDRVRRLLNHADLNTTQVYLQSLGLLEE